MIYATLKTANNEYHCRLSAKRCVELEKALGKNPLKVFTDLDGTLPSLEDLMTIFHYSLVDLNHNFDEYAIFDEFCDTEEGDIGTFIEFLIEVFKVSGFIPKEAEAEAEKVDKKNKKSKN